MKLTWDNIGDKIYKAGLDHGVLYPYYDDYYHSGIAWNGLTGLDPNIAGNEVTKLYANNSLNDIVVTDEEFGGTVRCYTYPDEFEECIGYEEPVPGVYLNAQDRLNFGLCYRTLIGSDTDGTDAGFELHIVYNSLVTSSDVSDETINDSATPSEFKFTFSSIPEYTELYKPVSHIRISSLKIDQDRLNALLGILYGTDETDPTLPLPDDVIAYLTPISGGGDDWDGYPSSSLYPDSTIFPYGGS